MRHKPGLCAVVPLVILLLFQGLAPDLQAQLPPPPTPQQLDQLLAPVALYPDSLLAQITTASTNPQEILDVDNWLAQNQNMSVQQLTAAAQQQGFDPAFIALVAFPLLALSFVLPRSEKGTKWLSVLPILILFVLFQFVFVRRFAAFAVQVHEERQERHRGERTVPRSREVHRQDLRAPLDAHQHAQS